MSDDILKDIEAMRAAIQMNPSCEETGENHDWRVEHSDDVGFEAVCQKCRRCESLEAHPELLT